MDVLKTAILEMCRQKKSEAFCPSDVVKLMFPEDWEQFVEEVESTATEIAREGLIQYNQEGSVIVPIPNQSSDSVKLRQFKPK